MLPRKHGIVGLRLRTKYRHLLRPVQHVFLLEVDTADPKASLNSIGMGEACLPISSAPEIPHEEDETESEVRTSNINTRYGRKVIPSFCY